jgi:tetratricopeptide (TPR) repeat protein
MLYGAGIMTWLCRAVLTGLIAWSGSRACGQSNLDPFIERHWFELCTAHFNIYSCGATQSVANLATKLEQFREAYSLLAGAQAVASPPIIVMAFPNHETMKPFLPLYQDKPAHLAAFFHRGSDENLIVLSLAGGGADSQSMETIFHEYSHLLLRHNQQFWPIWLKEGMAEIYSTFEVTGEFSVRMGRPIEPHLRMLKEGALMPLNRLFAVTRESPEYNEREHQGMFYAESWLLTHYLMLGNNPANKARFGRLTTFLRQGQSSTEAFTNAFQVPLSAMETQLRRYLERGKFEPLPLALKSSIYASRGTVVRTISPAETAFRLGDELLRIGRDERAESYFVQGQKLAPASPLPVEGLGLLAAKRQQPEKAVVYLGEALHRGSQSFLAHYAYAMEKLRLTAEKPDRYSAVPQPLANEIRSQLQLSLKLMPDFGPAHHLLGFFELVQAENFSLAEQHLKIAIQLEPENHPYLLSLAQAQLSRHDDSAARHTLEMLRLPYVEPELRTHAEELLGKISSEGKKH